MATKRNLVKEDEKNSDEQSTAGNKSNGTKQETKRVLRKLKNLDSSSNNLRWIIVVLVFSLAILGLIYYYNYYQPIVTSRSKVANKHTPSSAPNNKQQKSSSKESAEKTAKNKPSETKKKTKNTKKKPQATPSSSDKSTSQTNVKNENANQDSYQSKDAFPPKYQTENLKLYPKKLRERLLRLPVPPSDADRPLALEIVTGDDFLMAKDYSKALESFNAILKRLPQSPRGLYGKAMALENIAVKRGNMKVLDNAIDHYRKVSLESFLAPEIINEACLIQLVTLLNRRGRYNEAMKAGEKLCATDPENSGYAIQLGITFLRGGKIPEAKKQFVEVLEKWPDSPIAKANLGYIHYTEGDCGAAVPLLMAGLEEDKGIKKDPRFYLYAGDCLVRVDMYNESLDLYKVAVDLELFPSLWQRPLIHETGLRAQPWWSISDTGIEDELSRIQDQIDIIKSELVPLVSEGKFPSTSSSSADQTVWTLYSGGYTDEENCDVVPQSCDLINNITQSVPQFNRKDVKVLLLPPSLHIRPHVGSTNTRLRAVLPFKLPTAPASLLTVRVAEDKRELEEGVLYVMDDSFEQELWYQSTESSLVLVLEFWHPDLPDDRRERLDHSL